jgi:hypothetical protein
MNDGGRWSFDTYGEPYDFEEIERYEARRIRDRFNSELLDSYLKQFGISAFDENFYQTPKCGGYLVEVEGPLMAGFKEYTFAEARQG